MLSLTMKNGEYLLIGDDIKITFQGGSGKDSLYIGVNAPKSVKVIRSGLFEKIVAEKAAAGDAEAIKANEAIAADKAERERERRRKESISGHVREHLAKKKARQTETVQG